MTQPYSDFLKRNPYPVTELAGQLDGTVVVLGAAPSLEEVDKDKLFAAHHVIATNSAWRWAQPYFPVAAVITDSLRLKEEEAKGIGEHPPLLFCAPSLFRLSTVNDSWAEPAKRLRNAVFLEGGDGNTPLFRPDIGLNTRGGSVIFPAIDIAFFMGATRVVLVGVELDYEQEKQWWHGEYRSPALKGVDPKRADSALGLYRAAAERRGWQLLNATPCGNVTTLERVKLEEL